MQNFHSAQILIPKTGLGVKFLIISNLLCWFFLVLIVQNFFLKSPLVFHVFGFVPAKIESHFFIWQFFTYMFLHSGGIFHILFNMLILWMFGSELEQLWQKKFFLKYYFFCGVGSAVIYFLGTKIYLLLGGSSAVLEIPVVGASGAVFGLILAYGWIFRERVILFMFIFPMKAKHFTMLIAAIELLSVLNAGFGSPVANLAHLGGLISGFLFLKFNYIFERISFKKTSSLYKKLKILQGGKSEELNDAKKDSVKYWN